MDERSIELAKNGLDDYQAVHAARYDMARDMLRGSLTDNGQHIENMRAREVVARSNLGLLKGFVEQLPSYTNSGVSIHDSFIPAEDPYVASQVQANVVWLQQKVRPKDKSGIISPYYVIGETTDTAKLPFRAPSAASKLLLFAAVNGRPDPFRAIKVWDKELGIARSIAEVPMSAGYTEWEMSRLYDGKTNTMRIREDHGSISTKPAHEARLSYPPAFKDLAKEIGTVGMNAQLIHVVDQTGITDNDLATYDVFSHLNRLAVAFDKTEQLHKLLEERKSDAPS